MNAQVGIGRLVIFTLLRLAAISAGVSLMIVAVRGSLPLAATVLAIAVMIVSCVNVPELLRLWATRRLPICEVTANSLRLRAADEREFREHPLSGIRRVINRRWGIWAELEDGAHVLLIPRALVSRQVARATASAVADRIRDARSQTN